MFILNYIKKYWKSLIVVVAILYLSVMKQPSNEKLVLFEGIDKVVHFCMYFGLSSMLWLDHLIKHKGNYNLKHIMFGAVFLPIAWGGAMEISQELFTTDRACELMDFIANTSGVIAASLLFGIYLKYLREKK